MKQSRLQPAEYSACWIRPGLPFDGSLCSMIRSLTWTGQIGTWIRVWQQDQDVVGERFGG
jgi:hypothetical protein